MRRACSRVTHTRLFLPGVADAITTLPHLHEGVLVFPSRQIFSAPRFCQQITGAITASRLEGLTSGLRITHTAVPLNARHSRCPRRIGADGWTRTNDIPPGAVLYRLSYVCVVPLRELPARHRVRSSELAGAAPAYGAELIYTSEGEPKSLPPLWRF